MIGKDKQSPAGTCSLLGLCRHARRVVPRCRLRVQARGIRGTGCTGCFSFYISLGGCSPSGRKDSPPLASPWLCGLPDVLRGCGLGWSLLGLQVVVRLLLGCDGRSSRLVSGAGRHTNCIALASLQVPSVLARGVLGQWPPRVGLRLRTCTVSRVVRGGLLSLLATVIFVLLDQLLKLN